MPPTVTPTKETKMASKKWTPEAENLYRNLTAAVRSMGKVIKYTPRAEKGKRAVCGEVAALYHNIKVLQEVMGMDHVTEVTLLQ